MPAKRRRRPVVEEIVETPPVEPSKPEKVEVQAEIAHEVAKYDEPPIENENIPQKSVEVRASEFLAQDKPQKSHIKLIFAVTTITALVVGFVAGGVYVYMSGVNEVKQVQNTPTPSSTPEATPTPSPKPIIKLDSFSVNVLNGSGIIGAAGKVKDSLEAAGFKVTGTGNASNYAFKTTAIQVKKDLTPDVLEALKAALSDYKVTEGDNLASSSKYDIVVTAGKE